MHQNSQEGEHLALFEAILSLKNTVEAARFFEDLCTPAELQDMSDRWQVVRPLKENIPYRKIHEMTGASVTTISRVARSLHYGTGGYELILNRIAGKFHGRKKQIENSYPKKRALK